MIDYIAAIESESARFHELISTTRMSAAVPSCPDWTVADLAWHLSEVQYFWGSIVGDLLQTPESLEDLQRPPEYELADLFNRQSARLVAALSSRDPEDVCWSWHDAGHSVGWVRRRQAHEALIHRVDAELASATQFTLDGALAADGVDEVIRVMLDLDNLPEWGAYEPDGSTVAVEVEDGPAAWSMELGRFMGTSPNTGKVYDDPVVKVTDAVAEPTATLRGSGADLDLWLWGRGPLDPITVEGDRRVAEQLRAAAMAGTQ